ncbi:hypothetical protein C1646_773643 [Rhizophagus diaphanus]|nr:hypothetical protein C1646_773643 [Rhizophagus diaphanus] [Rhizophagus sp. MUCL 43196]
MATKTATPKIQKPKANNFVLVLEQFLEKYNLMADSTPEQLSKHAPELDALLPDWMAHRCVKVALARGTDNRRSFSKERIDALVLDKRKGKLTIEERAEYCAKTGDFVDIIANHWALGPKSNDENEIVTSVSHQSTFRVKLVEGGVDPAIIEEFAKDQKHIQEVTKRLQNIDITKELTMQNLVDMIVMLSMRPLEVLSLQINHYEVDPSNVPAWYKEGYSWYCTGYKKSRTKVPCPFFSIEKNPERARELLTWIQDAIKADKLCDPVYAKSGKRSTQLFREFLKPYKAEPRKLRHYGKRHASRAHGSKNPTPEHLKYLLRIALRQESDHLDAGDNYAMSDTESENDNTESNSDSGSEASNSPKSQTQATSPTPQPRNNEPKKTQTIDMNSMLAEMNAILSLKGYDIFNWLDQNWPSTSPALEPEKGLDLRKAEMKKGFFRGLNQEAKIQFTHMESSDPLNRTGEEGTVDDFISELLNQELALEW